VRLRKSNYLDEANEPRAIHLKRAKVKCENVQKLVRVNLGNSFLREDPMVRSGNYISALHEWAQKQWPIADAKGLVLYTDTQGRDGWTSTVKITRGGVGFTGAVCVQKMAAQQSAAQQAYERLAGTS